MEKAYTVNWYHNGEPDFEAGYAKALALRIAVFVKEQGFENEADDTDYTAHHLVMENGAEVVAVARIFSEDGGHEWHIGRVAVLQSMRGTGLGRIVVAECEKRIAVLGGSVAVLSAQQRVQPFYERCGYVPEGEPYLDEFCPHIDMRKVL